MNTLLTPEGLIGFGAVAAIAVLALTADYRPHILRRIFGR